MSDDNGSMCEEITLERQNKSNYSVRVRGSKELVIIENRKEKMKVYIWWLPNECLGLEDMDFLRYNQLARLLKICPI